MTHILNEKAHCESHVLILASILYLLKSPPIILCNPVFKNNFSTWYTAYWLVPTVSNPSVHIPQVETLKSAEQWHIALKQRRALSLIHLHAKQKNQCIRQKTGAQNIVQEIKQYQEKWLKHVQRMDTNRLPKQALKYKPNGRRNIG